MTCCENQNIGYLKGYGDICANCFSLQNTVDFDDKPIDNSVISLTYEENKDMKVLEEDLKNFVTDDRRSLIKIFIDLKKRHRKEKKGNFYNRKNLMAFLCNHYNIPHSFKTLKSDTRRHEMEKWVIDRIPEKLDNVNEFEYCKRIGFVVDKKIEECPLSNPRVWCDRDIVIFWKDVINNYDRLKDRLPRTYQEDVSDNWPQDKPDS